MAGTGARAQRANGPSALIPKRLMWLDTTNHIDLYGVSHYVGPAVAATVAWFDRHLTRPEGDRPRPE